MDEDFISATRFAGFWLLGGLRGCKKNSKSTYGDQPGTSYTHEHVAPWYEVHVCSSSAIEQLAPWIFTERDDIIYSPSLLRANTQRNGPLTYR